MRAHGDTHVAQTDICNETHASNNWKRHQSVTLSTLIKENPVKEKEKSMGDRNPGLRERYDGMKMGLSQRGRLLLIP